MRVINYDAPEDQATYVHRVGRTGRAGRTGTGISFVLSDEVSEMRKIAKALGHDFGSGRTEAGAVNSKPRGEDRGPTGESRQGGSQKPNRGSKPRGGHGEKRQNADRPQSDGPRSKRRRRRRRKPAEAGAAN